MDVIVTSRRFFARRQSLYRRRDPPAGADGRRFDDGADCNLPGWREVTPSLPKINPPNP